MCWGMEATGIESAPLNCLYLYDIISEITDKYFQLLQGMGLALKTTLY